MLKLLIDYMHVYVYSMDFSVAPANVRATCHTIMQREPALKLLEVPRLVIPQSRRHALSLVLN